MPYANPFNATIMPGNTQAKLIDDFSRQGYAALIERFNDKLVIDATADPWVLKSEVTGLKVGKVLTLPFNHFLTRGGGSTVIGDINVSSSGDAGPLLCGFTMPIGVTITAAVVLMATSALTNLELYKVSGSPPFTKVSIAAWTQAASGQVASPNGATLNSLVDNEATYYISVDIPGSNPAQLVQVYGARIIYNTPSHLNTI